MKTLSLSPKAKVQGPKSSVTASPTIRALLRIWTLAIGLWSFQTFSQTAVLFPLAQMTGTTNDTTVTVRPVINPVKFHRAVYWLPPAGIQLATKNGSATTNLIPNDYNVTIAGVPGAWKISVSDTNVTLNAAEIGNLTVYSANGPLPGVTKINAGNNITISPPNGMGVVTINSTGGGGSVTNAYEMQAGNKLITISTNLTDLVYTISGVSQTNGYPWGVLYDAAGAATAATNGWPWGMFYDPAGTAQAATNGISIASGLAAFRGTNTFDRAGAATAATNGLSLASGLVAFRSTNSFDAAGSAIAATNGFPWGALYDAAGSATAATNGWPWGVLYDASGAAQAATNGYPWGGFYDSVGTAQGATNGISIASGLAAFRGTNTFDQAGAATAATNGLSLASGLAAFRSANSFDAAGSAIAATNGFPWGVFYDAAGSATAATNGWPWGVRYDAAGAAQAATNGYPWGGFYDSAGAAQAATNGLSIASGLAAFRGTNTFASTNPATASTRGLVKVDNSTITVSIDGTISATTGGGGSVTSVGLSVPGEYSITGSPITTSGTLAITRTADANFLGFGATNVGFLKISNSASIGGQSTMSALVLTNGFTNQALTASTLIYSDANKKLTSVANAAGVFTNDGSGNFGYAPLLDASALKASQYASTDGNTNLVSTRNGNNWTNLVTSPASSDTNLVAQKSDGSLIPYSLSLLLSQGGGSVPSGLVTNASPVPITTLNGGFSATNAPDYFTNNITHVSMLRDTNGVVTIMTNGATSISLNPLNGAVAATNFTANGPGTNYLGGDTKIVSRLFSNTNSSPFSTVDSAGLHTAAINAGWTNDLGARADLVMGLTLTNSATAWPLLTFTDAVSGECYTNSQRFLVSGTNILRIQFSDISPGDYGSLSNYGPAGSVIINSATWKLK